MKSLLVSIDPGGTTGFCVFQFPSGIITETYAVHTALEVRFSNRLWFRSFFLKYQEEIGIILLERFKLFRNPKTMEAQINSEFPSVRIIGIVEAQAEMYGLFDRIRFQEPGDRKSANIPRYDWAAVGPSDHVKDAYRHARYYTLMHREQAL